MAWHAWNLVIWLCWSGKQALCIGSLVICSWDFADHCTELLLSAQQGDVVQQEADGRCAAYRVSLWSMANLLLLLFHRELMLLLCSSLLERWQLWSQLDDITRMI